MEDFVKSICYWKNSISPNDCATLIVAILTLIATIYIPEKIKWEQLYQQLLSDYRSYDFARAIQNVIEFFTTDCNKDIENIQVAYEKRFLKEINDNNLATDSVLHYQRRLLAQFYYQLDLCAKTPFFLIGKNRVKRDFTKNESHILKILYFMNEAVSNSDVIFKDISCDERVPKSEKVKGLNKYVSEIYHILKSADRHMK